MIKSLLTKFSILIPVNNRVEYDAVSQTLSTYWNRYALSKYNFTLKPIHIVLGLVLILWNVGFGFGSVEHIHTSVYNSDEGAFGIISLSYLAFSTIALVASGLVFKREGNVALLPLLGWLGIWLALIIREMALGGLLPVNFFTTNVPYIFILIESILLSFALIARYRHVKEEKKRLEINLNSRERDISFLSASNQLKENLNKTLVSDLEIALKGDEKELKKKIRSLIFSMNNQLSSNEKIDLKIENIDAYGARFEKVIKANYPHLTKGDIELCGYIKLNMSVKEIAELRKTSTSSIKTARYRLKQRLGLNDQKLDDYIRNNY